MKRNLRIIDHVQVKSPCTEDWNEMVGNDEVRFCSHCSKHVHNLSAMTRREAEALVLKSNGNLCIRYRRNPVDQTVVTLPVRLGNALTRRLSLPIAAGVMAVALNTAPALGQDLQPTGQQTITVESTDGKSPEVITNHGGGSKVSGVVKDQTDAVIADASVKLTNLTTGEERTCTTTEKGQFELPTGIDGRYSLEIESPGFAKFQQEVDIKAGDSLEFQAITLEIALDVETFTVGIIVEFSQVEKWVYHKDEQAELEWPELEPKAQEFWDDFYPCTEPEEVEALFLEKGYAPDIRGQFDRTALMEIAKDYKKLAQALLKYGANPNAQNYFGVTPLMYGMLSEGTAIPKMLIQAGADVNAADKDGRTALMLAAFDGKTKVVKLLIKAGADVNAKDKLGKTVLDYAIDANQSAVIKVLKAAGAKPSVSSKSTLKKETCTTR
ncbi:MAG: ankyrin repeat domain-containing protein [Acidobacteria bacterium]|nr:ankyrin repeat domain-containing protein [Acidobacteriota bacterium]